MVIKINGKSQAVDGPANIADLVMAKNLVPDKIVVEHNNKILPKEDWAGAALKEDDTIEILSFVGGG